MKPVKKWNRWEIVYRVPGYRSPFSEHFDTEEEANVRIAEIQLAKRLGTLKPPAKVKKTHCLTFSAFLDEYVEKYGANKWGDSYYSINIHRINDYIKPLIGNLLLRDITTHDLDTYYTQLLSTPAVVLKGHKDTQKTVSYSVIEKIDDLLRSAFNQAIKWEYIVKNPASTATVPKAPMVQREVWSPAQARTAINACKDLNLKVCLLLGIGCSMRAGEILGLQWSSVTISEETLRDNTSILQVRQELKRCDKSALRVLEARKRSNVYFTFPETKSNCKTSLVLKMPKTESSVRRIYLPNSVATALMELKEAQSRRKEQLHGLYQDFDMVIAQPDGRPTEERLLARDFKALAKANDLPEVVFHSLRHLSTSMKLQLSGGDIKAVQGDTGHSQANMVTDVYSHTFDENRRRIADQMETAFFEKIGETEAPAPNQEQTQVINLLNANPELTALILAMAKK